jgi:uncharacterized protein
MKRPAGRRRALIAAVLVLGTVLTAGVAGAGWYFSAQLLTPDHSPPNYDITIRAVEAATVEMDKTTDTTRQGTFGLEWGGGHAIVGKVITTSRGTVTRAFQGANGSLHVGEHVVLTTPVYQGDPEAAFGIPSDDVLIPAELGMLPAWYVPSRLGDFVIVVHGHNAPQTDGLRLVPTLNKLGLPIVLIRYRNDVGAPASPDHLLHLGDTEWRDVEAAVRWALAQGATRVVLVGISMGGAVVQMFMKNSSLAARVPAVILDSPVLDWDAVINFQAARRGVPTFLVWPTEQVIRLRIGFDLTSYNQVRDAGSMRAPTLLFQDGQETFLPPEGAASLAKARPDLVEYHLFPDAGHTQEWNVDQVAYESFLTSFVVRKLGLASP